MFYGVKEVMAILGVGRTKSYEKIKELHRDLVKAGYTEPPAGRIQKKYFCERFNLNLKECEAFLKKGAA